MISYGFIFPYPFVFDDFGNIAGNPSIRDLFDPVRIIRFNPLRCVTYFTFAINYAAGGTDVTGYHLVNILIHIANGLLVWGMVTKLFRTPVLKKSPLAGSGNTIALFSALIFTAHPLMTEAVTYIVQRLVSLSTLFFLGTINLYLHLRLNSGSPVKTILLQMAIVIFMLLAFFSRESAWTLPVILLVTEYFFLREVPKHVIWIRRGIVLVSVMSLLILLWIIFSGKYFVPIPPREGHPWSMTPFGYYLTQIRVLCTYLRLLILPARQVFDWYYPLSASIAEWKVLVCMFLLAGALLFTIRLYPKYRLLSFGLAWFFITVLPQSLVPRPNVIFEHRLYQPAIGIIIFLVTLITLIPVRIVILERLLAGIVVVLMILTISRNRVWRNEVVLWSDTVQKAPENARGWINLGNALYRMEDYQGADSAFAGALVAWPGFSDAWYNQGLTAFALNQPQRGLDCMTKAISLEPDQAIYYHDRGVIQAMQGNYREAVSDFSRAIELEPELHSAYENREKALKLLRDTASPILIPEPHPSR